MLKILHVIHSDLKFVEGAVDFIQRCDSEKFFSVVYLNTGVSGTLINKKFHIKQREIRIKNGFDIKSMRGFIKLCEKFDYVIFHSLFIYTLLKIMIILHPGLLKKVVWVGFGADLYISNTISAKLASMPNRIIANRCYGYVGIFPPDCCKFKRIYPYSEAKIFYAPYYGTTMPEEYKRYNPQSKLEVTIRKNDCVYIQIGHSADPSMRHKEILLYLKRFSDRNIKIILPLSYGDVRYAEMIEKLAKDIFSEKVICLKDFMEEDEYFEYLKIVDLGIFNVFRQQGLGNIQRLIFRNVKIYMPSQSVMYSFFREKGVPINKVEDLKECTFDEFVSLPKNFDRQKYIDYVTNIGDERPYFEQWNNIYKHLRESFECRRKRE